MNNHSLQNTEKELITLGTTPTAAHRRYFHRHLQPHLHGKTQGFVLRLPPQQAPCNIHAAITMHCAASRSKPASLYAHGNTRWQQSCSHSNAICNHRFKKRIGRRTQEEPLVAAAEHRGGTDYARNDPSRNRCTQEVPFIAACSHIYTEKHKVSCFGFLTPPFINVLLCDVVSHRPSSVHCSLTILFVRNSEDSFPTSLRQSSNLTISTAPPKQNSFLLNSFAELLWLQKPFAWNFGTPWNFEFHHGSAFISHHKSAAKATSAKAVHWSLASLALGVALVPSSFPVSAPAQAVSPGFRNPAASSRT